MEPDKIKDLWKSVWKPNNRITYSELFGLLENISPSKNVYKQVLRLVEKYSKKPVEDIELTEYVPPDVAFVVIGWYEDTKLNRDDIIRKYNKKLAEKNVSGKKLSIGESLRVRAYIARNMKDLLRHAQNNIELWVKYRNMFMEDDRNTA